MKGNKKEHREKLEFEDMLRGVDGFTVPEGYFEALPQRIVERWKQRQRRRAMAQRRSMRSRIWLLMKAASVLLLLGMALWWWQLGGAHSKPADEFDAVSVEAVIEYLLDEGAQVEDFVDWWATEEVSEGEGLWLEEDVELWEEEDFMMDFEGDLNMQ